MLKKTIGIGIAIALALIIGIVISGGIRITKANTRVATLPAHGSRVLLLNELGSMQDGDPDITGALLIEETEKAETDLSSLPIFAPHIFSYVKRVIVPRFARSSAKIRTISSRTYGSE